MRRSRVYTAQALVSGDTVELTGSTGHYLARVLRLAIADSLTLFNGDGRDYAGEVCALERDRVSVRIGEAQVPDNESRLKITLVQAVSRGERMDFSLQKATELGVHCIQPVMSRRVEVRLDQEKQLKRRAHWQAVVVSACEQSGRAIVPEVRPLLTLQQWLLASNQMPADSAQRMVLDPLAAARLCEVVMGSAALSVLIGPEGGFSETEMEQLLDGGVTPVSLGPRVLRTETAGPAAIAVLQTIAGDF